MEGDMYVRRTLEPFLKKANKQVAVILVTGARQVGKTTLLRHLAGSKRTYVTLDDPLVLSLAKEDPALFFQRYEPPLLIDEIQYAPELLPYIKMMVDREGMPGGFWLTGSQQFHLMKDVSESLAGRVGIVRLLGMSRRELNNQGPAAEPFHPKRIKNTKRKEERPFLSLSDLYELIWRGSFPGVSLHTDVDRDLFYGSYVQTYIQRDVHHLAKVGDEMAFLKFLRACAARTAQLVNMADLARDADIAPNTAKSWLSILRASGVIHLLEPYHTNVTKRLVKTPKLYMLDTGLCSYLTEWSNPKTLEAGAMSGAILETWIMAELLKGYWHNGQRAPFYFYRDRDKKEVDLLIVQDGAIHPVEIKKTASPGKKDIKNFPVLEKLNMPVADGGVICLAEEALPLAQGVWTIPVSML